MCGIVGIWGLGEGDEADLARVVRRANHALRRRGPDGEGIHVDSEARLALAHRRLSVIDLSEAGAQPMASASGRYVITYNGEVYNFEGLRDELGSTAEFRGRSDTEVIVAAVERWGVREAIPRLQGMFALGVWDREERALWLARDPLGIKPLYYGRVGGGFAFASELAALRSLPGFDDGVDPVSLEAFLRFGYVPTPRSIHLGISKLPPGHLIRVDSSRAHCESEPYWTAAAAVERALTRPLSRFDDAVDALESAVGGAVERRLVADVPLGAFLSGGIDSSLVVAMMRRHAGVRVKTFSIGFDDPRYDESSAAKAVASHLGTEHRELILRPEHVIAAIPKMASVYSEPFADSSQLPTYLVAEMARREVTVALSGDGGDELCAGYNRHVWGPRVLQMNRLLPSALRRPLGAAFRATGQVLERSGLERGSLAARLPVRLPADKLRKLGAVVGADDAEGLHRTLSALDPRRPEGELRLGDWAADPVGLDPRASLMYRDLVSYLPDDILTKVDRATMAHGLEARVPLLDLEVLRTAWRIPGAMQVRGGKGKAVLRAVLRRHLPYELVERPKMGFSMPVGDWLGGELRDWAEGLLDQRALRDDEGLDGARIRADWGAHLEGQGRGGHGLWATLMYRAWRQELANG